MRLLVNFALGLLFGLGLVISGMANPAKVLNFLDLAGSWDPSLIFVMGGALAVTLVGYRLVFGRGRPLFAPQFSLPTKRDIDPQLVAGAGIFGIGWGLSGLCPGPALTALHIGSAPVLAFILAMLAGIWGARTLQAARAQPKEA
ncbi:YeeE/YedE family protein [Salmonella enterica subsp. enterica]|nr:YeeE/YedE family protein [Salmonella enterica subsp. enterica serovar Enteritidis]